MTSSIPSRALRVVHKAASPEALQLQLQTQEAPEALPGHAVVEVLATAVNPSDVKAALGLMPQAIWPRTPGRDFAARVVSGPAEWIGAEVWGTGGDLGITRDGSHARYLVLPVAALVRKPGRVPMAAAGTVGVPFITAFEGLRRAGLRGEGQTVAVLGANGKVGQAAVQLATRAGARVIAVERGARGYGGHSSQPVLALDGTRADLGEALLAATDGRGVDIAYNSVGSPYFAAALQGLAVGGTQILISTIERTVPFDILMFYRRNLHLLGVDSLKLSVVDCAAILKALAPGFDDGSLRAFDVDADSLVPLDQATDAYQRVIAGSSARVVLAP
ncbi:quinone oxidoreductase family protein [Hydrogenophaga sp. BPS33]|uniref:quinone oxidoreductase family protein n=1 Tax=Hydrogenophaga sp. BPS33 TaxID=2651974 RepID=UPI00131F87CB|nr:zinc-binding alcohol dehydrogenase family protein [Hydrogenophaga sp. BPS33]QHE87377.1 zinc-binding alcohol dehydrogenase family protein [Hydrogenophaga sp. BPS33]